MSVEIFIQFILTFVIELIILWLFLRKQNKFIEITGFVLLINLFTWPLAQLFYGDGFNFFVIEILIVIVESALIMLLFKVRYWKSLLISFIANFISASFGWFFS